MYIIKNAYRLLKSSVCATASIISAADKLTYCAFLHKSTNFGTKVDQYLMNKSGCGAIGQLPLGGRGSHFPKWPPVDNRNLDKVCCWRFQ